MRIVGAAQAFDGSLLLLAGGDAPALALKLGRGGPTGVHDVAPGVRVFVLVAGGAYQAHTEYELAHSETVLDLGPPDLTDVMKCRPRATLL